MTHLSDLEVKVMGQILTDVVAKHKSGELRCPATALIINPAPGDKNGPALGVISSHNIKHNGKNIKKIIFSETTWPRAFIFCQYQCIVVLSINPSRLPTVPLGFIQAPPWSGGGGVMDKT